MCGYNKNASIYAGIDAKRNIILSMIIAGVLSDIAGSGFAASVAGYGFLVLAVMIFDNWKPLNILFAALLFSLFKVVGSYASSISFLPHFENVKMRSIYTRCSCMSSQ